MRRIVTVFYDIAFLSINMESSISSLFANLGHQRFTIFCIDLSIYFVRFTLNKYQIIILKFVIPYFCHLISLYIYVMDFSHFHVSFIFKIIITSFSFPFPSKPTQIPLLALFQIHDLFFIDCCYNVCI